MAEEKKHKHEEKIEKKKDAVETPEKETKKEKKKEVQKPKRDEAFVNGQSLHISTKTASYISKFIRGKGIQKAILDLEEVAKLRKPVPMKGEIPHRKGKIMSGRYPQKAAKIFIKLLKSLQANANFLGVENPVISESISNIAARPFGKFGSVRRKRTHVKIIAKSAKEKSGRNKK